MKMKKLPLILALAALAGCTLPNGPVTSSPTSAPAEPKGVVASFKNCTNIEVALDNLKLGDELVVGSTQTLDLRFDNDYAVAEDFVQAYVVTLNNDVYRFAADEKDEMVASFDFVVPEGDINIYFHDLSEESEDENAFTVSYEKSDKYTVLGFENGKKYDYVSFYIEPTEGYKIDSVTYLAEGSETPEEVEYSVRSGTYMIYSITANLTLTITVSEAQEYTITYNGGEHLDATTSKMPTSAWSGSTIVLQLYAADGYYLESFTVTDESGTSLAEPWGGEATFKMPDANVVVDVVTGECAPITIGTLTNVESVTVYSGWDEDRKEVTSYGPDDDLQFVVEAKEGFAVSSVTVTATNDPEFEAIELEYWDGSWSAYETLPEDGITVSATAEKAALVTIAETEHCTLELDNGETSQSFVPGAEVTVTVYEEEGYKVTRLYYIAEGSTEEVDLQKDWFGDYVFEMPETAVTIYAETEKLEYTNISVTTCEGVSSYQIVSYLTYDQVENESLEVVKDTDAAVSIYVEETNYIYSLSMSVDGGEAKELESYFSSYDNSYEAEFVATGDNVVITVTRTAKVALNTSTELPSGLEMTFNDEATIPTLYSGDSLTYTITTEAPANHKWVVTLDYTDATLLDAKCEGNKGTFTNILGDFTLKVVSVEVQYATITIVNNFVQLEEDGYGPDEIIGNVVYVKDAESYANITETSQFEIGRTISIQKWANFVTVTVTHSGGTDTVGMSYSLEVTGDVTITISNAE